MGKAVVLIGVDVETDVGSFTPFYEGVKRGVPLLLDIFENEGVKGTFYFTGDAARENPVQAKLAAGGPSEVGCHSLYHETVGDELFPIPGVRPLLPHEVEPRLRLATEWVENASGTRPVSFRSPRLWGGTAAVNALERLGYSTDASYPRYFYRKQFAPYYPSRSDWREKGGGRLLEIPNFADMTMVSRDGPLGRDRDQWPLFRTKGAEILFEKIKGFVRFVSGKNLPAVVCLYIHPWEFIPCERKYNFGEATVIPDRFITKNTGKAAARELVKLIRLLKGFGAEFLTAREIGRLDIFTGPAAGAESVVTRT
jgi:peptidoglycan/xylan/chitin deacetylase (PgdA/CDA1 family)